MRCNECTGRAIREELTTNETRNGTRGQTSADGPLSVLDTAAANALKLSFTATGSNAVSAFGEQKPAPNVRVGVPMMCLGKGVWTRTFFCSPRSGSTYEVMKREMDIYGKVVIISCRSPFFVPLQLTAAATLKSIVPNHLQSTYGTKPSANKEGFMYF